MSNQQLSKQQVVTLRLYKDTEILKKADGTIANKNQTVKLPYPSRDWDNFIKKITALGYGIAEVEQVTEETKPRVYDPIEIPANIVAELKTAMSGPAKELTPEQKEIAELKAQMAALLAGKNTDKEPLENGGETKTEISPELKDARERYFAVFEKKVHHSWDVDTINAKIAELKAQ